MLFGKVNPGGKLPVIVPAQRRPGADLLQPRADRPAVRRRRQKYNSRYRDLPTCDPLYPFGYGLSYTTFTVVEPAARAATTCRAERAASRRRSTCTNTGDRAGDEVVQLYIHDPVASISQPVRRLRGFQRVTLAPGADADGHVHARPQRLRLLRQPRASSSSSPGEIDVYAGDSSTAELTKSFTVE